jgi:hypothetical protein
VVAGSGFAWFASKLAPTGVAADLENLAIADTHAFRRSELARDHVVDVVAE